MNRVAAFIVLSFVALPVARAAADHQSWSFEAPFGGFETTTLQKGFLVYQADCAECHGLRLIRYRDLRGIGLSRSEILALTSKIKRVVGKKKIAVTPDDRMRALDSRGSAASAVVAPDLSLTVAARRGGPEALYSLLTGYRDAPPDVAIIPGYYYNAAYPGGQIAMAPALKKGSVTFADGVKPDVGEMAHDVTVFLAWSADPTLNERKLVGLTAMIYLVVFWLVGFIALRPGRGR